jgi:hypothetical protein
MTHHSGGIFANGRPNEAGMVGGHAMTALPPAAETRLRSLEQHARDAIALADAAREGAERERYALAALRERRTRPHARLAPAGRSRRLSRAPRGRARLGPRQGRLSIFRRHSLTTTLGTGCA